MDKTYLSTTSRLELCNERTARNYETALKYYERTNNIIINNNHHRHHHRAFASELLIYCYNIILI